MSAASFVVSVVSVAVIALVKKKRKTEEMEYIQERDAIHQRSAERRENRKAKNDEIRKKYGLGGDTIGTYTRFE